jgi:ribosomal protein L3 glutamine methyltransferase
MTEIPETEVLESLKTIRDYLRFAITHFTKSKLFFGHGTDNATDEALYIILHALHLPYENTESYWDAKLLMSEKKEILDLLKKRIEQRIPAAYLVNTAYFAGLSFYVNENVLIPRSPIAELIEQHFSPYLDQQDVKRILDLGTGSGCIAIACAYAFPEADVDAVDISAEALKVTQENIQQHELNDRVHPIQSDLYSALKNRRYDLIVSNPPYVNAHDLATMPPEFHHEPRLGLAAGEDGLACVHEILRQAKYHLNPNGILVVEVGNSQAALVEAYPNLPFIWMDFSHGGEGVFLLTSKWLNEFFLPE